MFNRFSTLKSVIAAPTLQDISTAEIVVDRSQRKAANAKLEKFEFVENGTNDTFAELKELFFYSEKSTDGKLFNRCEIRYTDGTTENARVYGVKDLPIIEETINASEAKKRDIKFGYCTQSGKPVAGPYDAQTGKLIAITYVKVA